VRRSDISLRNQAFILNTRGRKIENKFRYASIKIFKATVSENSFVDQNNSCETKIIAQKV
jgi:hypothetical protein